MPKLKRKNQAAAALGRKGGLARLQKMTPAERSASARKAVLARWHGKERLERWWGVFERQENGEPSPVFWSKKKEEAVARCRELFRQEELEPYGCSSYWVESICSHNPTRFTLTNVFEPDTSRQMEALKDLVAGLGEGGQS